MLARYSEPLETAVFFFPLIAFFFTLPFMLYQYHKYGAVLFLRAIMTYSFILYMLCICFLTILPLPQRQAVSRYASPWCQPIPFRGVYELFQNPNFQWREPSTYSTLVLNRGFFQLLFNVLMTVPLGIYLRYYFQKGLKTVLWLTFLLSLCFELIQLSGLFFIYPRPYRLADVDDLLTNTLGGYVGYLLSPLLTAFLPTPERMNHVAYQRSKHVSLLRRLCAAFMDCFTLFILFMVYYFARPLYFFGAVTRVEKLAVLFGYYSAFVLLYFGVGEWLFRGRSPGKWLLRIRLVDSKTLKPPKLWQCMVRYGLFYLVVVPAPVFSLLVLLFQGLEGASTLTIVTCILFLLVFVGFCVYAVLFCGAKGGKLPHGYLSRTMDVSTLRKRRSRKPALPSSPA